MFLLACVYGASSGLASSLGSRLSAPTWIPPSSRNTMSRTSRNLWSNNSSVQQKLTGPRVWMTLLFLDQEEQIWAPYTRKWAGLKGSRCAKTPLFLTEMLGTCRGGSLAVHSAGFKEMRAKTLKTAQHTALTTDSPEPFVANNFKKEKIYRTQVLVTNFI